MRLNGILPAEATSDALRIVLNDRHALLVEQHQGILSFDQDCIRLRGKGGYLTVRGERLALSSYGDAAAAIAGRIDSIVFTP